MHSFRIDHTVTLLNNGQVLVTGGDFEGDILISSELYNPLTDTWAFTGSMQQERANHAAVLLPNGKVLVVGGFHDIAPQVALNNTELYDPTTGNWTQADDLLFPVMKHTASLLTNGNILVAGGDIPDDFNGYPINASMIYSPSLEAITSSNVIAKLLPSHQTFMIGDQKVSAAIEDKFKTVNNTQPY